MVLFCCIARGVLQCRSLAFFIAKGSCNGLDLLYYEGVSQWLLVKIIITCLDFWAKQKLLFGGLGLNSVT